jgi:hypothetical protein
MILKKILIVLLLASLRYADDINKGLEDEVRGANGK